MMRSKLGLHTEESSDVDLIISLEKILQLTETDMTIFFRKLSVFSISDATEGLTIIKDAFYFDNEGL